MSKSSVAKGIKLNSFDDLFGAETPKDGIIEVPIKELHAFSQHPFKVLDNEEMDELVKSVKEKGVLSPILIRNRELGGYEIISGHRRAHATARAGFETIPAILKELSDDDATVLMVDANIQREEILPSEKAKAYKMKYEALKNQGLPGNSLQCIGKESGENYKAVQRYIWLARLGDDLLGMVDNKKLGLVQGVSISALSEEEQELLYSLIAETDIKLSTMQAATIKQFSQDGKLTEEFLARYLNESKEHFAPRKVTIKKDKLNEYFPDNYSEAEIESIIYRLLDEWKGTDR